MTALELVIGGVSFRDSEDGFKFKDRVCTKASEPGTWSAGLHYCDTRKKAMMPLHALISFRKYVADDFSGGTFVSGTVSGIEKTHDGVRGWVRDLSFEEQNRFSELPNHDLLYAEKNSDIAQIMRSEGSRKYIMPIHDIAISCVPNASGISPYEEHSLVQAFLPHGAAKENAEIMCLEDPSELGMLCVNRMPPGPKNMLISWCLLNFFKIQTIPTFPFYYIGHVRGW